MRADDELRARLHWLRKARFGRACAVLEPADGLRRALAALGRRWLALDAEARELEAQISALIAVHALALLARHGIDAMRAAYSAPGAQGYDTSGPTTDNALTRSEERMHVGTATEETGRAGLRRYVVTETVQPSVPVSHEEVRVEGEPITEANAGPAMAGPEISEEEHEVAVGETVRPLSRRGR